jgi:predicted transcriptional regulator
MGTQKDATQQYTFRIPVDLKAEMERIATEEDRSLSKQIIVALRNFVKENSKGK